ncbi:S9 family peptidase [Sphingosinicella rhizophila]|uniref:DPP IV N-terminal domain-containing protein n=1 Tax=Sphingosinicella rhizophila TaxID=3050082 RepID=A0ABU3QAT8_9SPHN|nr:DPP IV N-terminal domain-containing protein [Sphingosinicella sp. GR2756]MDT9600118.1 DPP IV N-terminal domain-containing protein [Sphingosinicella sp. GR2756]
MKFKIGLMGLSAMILAAPPVIAQTALSKADYDRAVRFLPQNAEKQVLNGTVTPHWLPGGDLFWYRRQTAPDRAEFVIVDPAAGGSRTPAFDHEAIAAGLAKGLAKPVAADQLPFKVFRYGDGGAIEAVVDGKLWSCAGVPVACTSSAAPPPMQTEIASPDGKWLAFVKDNNLWVKPVAGGEGFALTSDGIEDYGWGTPPGVNYIATAMKQAGAGYPPALLWSPDSSRLLIHRVDDRKTGEMGLVQAVPPDGSVRPRVHRWRMPMPGDANLPMTETWIFDVASRKAVKVDVAPAPFGISSPIEGGEIWWTSDGKAIGMLTRNRYLKKMDLYRVDPASGGAKLLVSEEGKTFVEAGGLGFKPMARMLGNGEVLWFSERDGQGRLYLYGANGKVKKVLGTGPGQITRLIHLDEAKGQAIVRANGRDKGDDPYVSNLYRIDLRTGAMTRLTPEDGEHLAGRMDGLALGAGDPFAPPGTTDSVSPSGRYFVDSVSTVDTPPVTYLRRADGKLVTLLEKADIRPLKAGGFTAPEAFTATAADGTTRLYGVMLKPSNFDPANRYPIIDQIYPGPQARRTPNDFMGAIFDHSFAQAMAELGFIVVLVDGRGTPGRTKAFLDASYGKLANGGFLEDHVAAIKELARSRPWMDVDRVGIYGISGGGNAAARAMFAFPDFFKVGVAHAGNHDQRGYTYMWGESYNGPIVGDNYAATSNAAIAKNLTGKLLLMHGDMDSNVSPALTLQVADALIKANKDFDLMIIPNLGHAWGNYATRMTWDYMVRNLMGAEPPKEYAFPAEEK